MYWGSVRFYKHLILTVIALLIIIPAIGCFTFGHAYYNMKGKLKDSAKVDANASIVSSTQMAEKKNKDLPYQNEYPDLYVEQNSSGFEKERSKTVYLTFDDGPSARTSEILDILKENEIHATFFVVYKDDEASEKLYQRIVAEGHTLAAHSTAHDYKAIYQSVETYLKDFAETAQQIERATGQKPTIFRFPGGSINSYNRDNYEPIIAEMLRRGYIYYDWNVSSGDAAPNATSKSIYNAVVNGVSGRDRAIVLMHDSATKVSTAAALPEIIEKLQDDGYKFDRLDNTVKPICFSYIN